MIQGKPQLERRLKAIGDGRNLMGLIQIAVVAEAKKKAEPFKKTGNLQRGIVPGSLSATSATVEATAGYSAYVERGTGLYGPKKKKIVPKTAKVLAWRTGAVRLSGRSKVKGGVEQAGWAFAKSVKGRKATPFLLPGAKLAVKKLGADVVIRAWNDAG